MFALKIAVTLTSDLMT